MKYLPFILALFVCWSCEKPETEKRPVSNQQIRGQSEAEDAAQPKAFVIGAELTSDRLRLLQLEPTTSDNLLVVGAYEMGVEAKNQTTKRKLLNKVSLELINDNNSVLRVLGGAYFNKNIAYVLVERKKPAYGSFVSSTLLFRIDLQEAQASIITEYPAYAHFATSPNAGEFCVLVGPVKPFSPTMIVYSLASAKILRILDLKSPE